MRFATVRTRIGERDAYVTSVRLPFAAEQLTVEDVASPRITKRVRKLADYVLDHVEDWELEAITARMDASPEFLADTVDDPRGSLRIARETRLIIEDGHDRHAAIRLALSENPDLAQQSISLVLVDGDLPTADPDVEWWQAAAQPDDEPDEARGPTEDAHTGARLVALNLALDGATREETDRFLERNFQLDDREAMLDEVYGDPVQRP